MGKRDELEIEEFRPHANRMKAEHIARKLSREQVAEQSGYTPRYIAAIENHEKVPKAHAFVKILRAIGCNANAVIFPEQTAEPNREDKLVHLYRLCDEHGKKVIEATLDAMVNLH